jgi:hypothetical protein
MKSTMCKPLLLLCSIWLIAGCSGKPVSSGADTSLYVVADPEVWSEMEPTIRDVFETVIMTPQPEKVFEVFWVPPDKQNQYGTRKNVVYIGILDAAGEISQRVADWLSDDVQNKIKEGSAFFFPRTAPWAKEQQLVVLASTSSELLSSKLRSNRTELYAVFWDNLVAETQAEMFAHHEQKELAEKLSDKYGWSLRIQHDYLLEYERPQDRFVMLRRSLPGTERWLFIHWLDDADPDKIARKWAINTRNRLTGKFYQNDMVDTTYTKSSTVEFQGRQALRLEGLWGNDQKVAGGPFRNYSFYDSDSGRIYMIDVAVYFPSGKKEPFLRQLDVMAQTFKTEYQLIGDSEEDS